MIVKYSVSEIVTLINSLHDKITKIENAKNQRKVELMKFTRKCWINYFTNSGEKNYEQCTNK